MNQPSGTDARRILRRSAAHKSLTVYSAKGRPALKTLSWEAGQCVGYDEKFRSGDDTQRAYVCHLVSAAPCRLAGPPPTCPGPWQTRHPVASPSEPAPLLAPPVEEAMAAVGETTLERLAAATSIAA